MFDALSPERRRLVLSAAITLVLLIMGVATISVIRLIAAPRILCRKQIPVLSSCCRATGVTSNRLSRWPSTALDW